MSQAQPYKGEDINREGLTWPKLLQPVRLLYPANNYACVKVRKFTDIVVQQINELFGIDIRGVILDIDECVAPHHGEIAPENVQAIIEMTAAGIKVKIFSNMKESDRYDALIKTTQGKVSVHKSRYAKPDHRGFMECCDNMNLPVKNVLMIGDNLMTDGGAVRAGIALALVQPYPTDNESHGQVLKRFPQRACRTLSGMLSDAYDRVLHRNVLTSQHRHR